MICSNHSLMYLEHPTAKKLQWIHFADRSWLITAIILFCRPAGLFFVLVLSGGMGQWKRGNERKGMELAEERDRNWGGKERERNPESTLPRSSNASVTLQKTSCLDVKIWCREIRVVGDKGCWSLVEERELAVWWEQTTAA